MTRCPLSISLLQSGTEGLPVLIRCRACLGGEAILQASMPELVDRSDGAQDIAFAGVLKKPHEAHWSMPTPAKLSERERSRPGFGVNEPAHEPQS